MTEKSRIRVAVVTGGHRYDVLNFHGLFGTMSGEMEVYIQCMDDFASASETDRDSYDVVVFYTMLMDGPTDEGLPWYAGKPKSALEHLGQPRQGLLVLHHALLAYPGWPVWDEIVGAPERGTFGYSHAQRVHVQADEASHPITAGIPPWDMTDETYTMPEPGADSQILLSVDHPKSMKHIAWVRQYKESRVFCFQSGHDNTTWAVPSFRTVLSRGIQWCARRT